MNKGSSVSRRWLRLALLVALTIGIGSGAAVRVSGQAGPITPAWTESNRWGQTGARSFTDSQSAPGATCINDSSASPKTVDIRVQSVQIGPAGAYKQGQSVSIR